MARHEPDSETRERIALGRIDCKRAAPLVKRPQCGECGKGDEVARGLCKRCYDRHRFAGTLPPKLGEKVTKDMGLAPHGRAAGSAGGREVGSASAGSPMGPATVPAATPDRPAQVSARPAPTETPSAERGAAPPPRRAEDRPVKERGRGRAPAPTHPAASDPEERTREAQLAHPPAAPPETPAPLADPPTAAVGAGAPPRRRRAMPPLPVPDGWILSGEARRLARVTGATWRRAMSRGELEVQSAWNAKLVRREDVLAWAERWHGRRAPDAPRAPLSPPPLTATEGSGTGVSGLPAAAVAGVPASHGASLTITFDFGPALRAGTFALAMGHLVECLRVLQFHGVVPR